METKRCGKCGQLLPVSEFYKQTKSKDGYQYVCRHCQAEYRKSQSKTCTTKTTNVSNTPLIASALDGKYKRNPALADFHPRELIDKLRARNYRGKLTITREVIV